jgi:hypothetical protein
MREASSAGADAETRGYHGVEPEHPTSCHVVELKGRREGDRFIRQLPRPGRIGSISIPQLKPRLGAGGSARVWPTALASAGAGAECALSMGGAVEARIATPAGLGAPSPAAVCP